MFSLKVRKNNVLKDFISVASKYSVSHIISFSKTEISTYMRVVRLPRGPTMTFKVNAYSLSRDVISSLRRHNMEPKQFQHHPLLVLNHFSGEGMQMKLMASMFQNMFPPITVNKVGVRRLFFGLEVLGWTVIIKWHHLISRARRFNAVECNAW